MNITHKNKVNSEKMFQLSFGSSVIAFLKENLDPEDSVFPEIQETLTNFINMLPLPPKYMLLGITLVELIILLILLILVLMSNKSTRKKAIDIFKKYW